MIISPISNTGRKVWKYWIQQRPVITQEFGKNPQIYNQFGLAGHNGIDFRAPVGTKVYAPFEGQLYHGNDGRNGYGINIRLKSHTRECVLAHLSEAYFTDGKKIHMGECIGKTGNTGFSTGPHLHFGYRTCKDGKVLNYNNGFKGYINIEQYIICWKGGYMEFDL